MSIYHIALSGAMTNQAAMNITAQNTANMNTDGYTRKVVNQATVVYGSQAGGVTVESIRRVSDQAAVARLRTASQEMQYAQAYMSGMQNIENLLGMEGLNLNSGFSELFAAIDEATISPESLVYRTQILASADNLASRFNGVMSQLETQLNALVKQQDTSVSTINSQLENIATLNTQIRDASGQGKDTAGYQDALDLQLAELSKSLGVNVLHNSDGTVELSTKSGQPLVVGNKVATIEKNLAAGGQFNTDLQLTFNGQTTTLQSPKGGELGAIDKLKDEQYLPLMDDINAIAVGFADAMNEILATGTDLNGESPGKALFRYDPSNPAGSLAVTGISAEELALSIDGNAGDGSIATAMSELASQPMRIAGRDINVFDAYSEILGTIGIATSQAQANYETATISISEAQTARDSVSAVSSNEEAANLMMYMNAYEANMKVIATANQMFDTVLNSF